VKVDGESAAMGYAEALARLVALARLNTNRVTAAQVEADAALSANREIVSAAARALAGGTNVFSYDEELDPREWFPFSGLIFTERL
jgi:hypothetical protein